MTAPVMAHGDWKTNGQMIADVARVYIHPGATVLDMTYGLGGWWTDFRPERLTAVDCDPDKLPEEDGHNLDFTRLDLWKAGSFDVVAFDPPYKLNGQPDAMIDGRYGVHERTSTADRHRLMVDGLTEAARVARLGGLVLAKCQDQVAGGRMHWQTDMLTEAGRVHGLTKIDRFQIKSYRAQPAGRRQIHARSNYSTLLVFRRDGS